MIFQIFRATILAGKLPFESTIGRLAKRTNRLTTTAKEATTEKLKRTPSCLCLISNVLPWSNLCENRSIIALEMSIAIIMRHTRGNCARETKTKQGQPSISMKLDKYVTYIVMSWQLFQQIIETLQGTNRDRRSVASAAPLHFVAYLHFCSMRHFCFCFKSFKFLQTIKNKFDKIFF
jgi:hypothetical protein